MPLTELFDLDVYEVSFVKEGANRKKLLAVKDKDGKAALPLALLEAVKKNVSKEMSQALKEAVSKGELGGKDGVTAEEVFTFILKNEDKIPEKIRQALGKKSESDDKTENQEEAVSKDTTENKKEETAKTAENEEKFETIVKKMREENEVIRKQNEQLQTQLSERIEKEKEQEFVAKAKELSNLPTQPEDLGKVMKELHDKAPEAFAKIEELLKSANELVKKGGVMKEAGSSASEGKDPESKNAAYDRLEKMAQDISEKSAGKINFQKAFDQVLSTDEGRKLYQAYVG